ncbi:MAG: S8 family serine peptidase, partial [Candidatus Thermoplasmatota archaeon]|nr:S8 family serine peptidase [Candidatus Thermoplasmatota archaeon]
DIISVGATSNSDSLASFSSVGPTAVYQIKPDLTAPGVSIYSTSMNNGYTSSSGTSMATPHVAGAAALLIQSHTDWSAQQVKQALMGTALDVGYNEYKQGAGRIDVVEANSTVMLADPPSLSLGRLSATSNTTTFTVTFENLATTWTNGTLSWNIERELTPQYSVTNNHTDLKAMLTVNTTAVNMTAGSKFTVQFTLTYDETAQVGHHLGNIQLTVGTETLHVPLAFYFRAPILLVDDDNTDYRFTRGPYNNHNPNYIYTVPFYARLDSSRLIGEALESLGVSFDVVAVRNGYDGPDLANLSQYRAVIWNSAFSNASFYYGGTSLTSNDLKAIKAYTDNGGNLWYLSTQAMVDLYGETSETDLPSTDALRAVFGLGGFTLYSGTGDPLSGTAGTFLAGASYGVDTASFGNVDYGYNLTPADGAVQVLSGSDTDPWGTSWTNITSMIAREGTLNKTLFSGFEFGHISAFDDRKDLVDKVLTWIDLRAHGSVSYTGLLKEGVNISFTGRVLDPRATESYVLEWDFDYVASTFTKDDSNFNVAHTYQDDGNFTVAMRIHELRTNT